MFINLIVGLAGLCFFEIILYLVLDDNSRPVIFDHSSSLFVVSCRCFCTEWKFVSLENKTNSSAQDFFTDIKRNTWMLLRYLANNWTMGFNCCKIRISSYYVCKNCFQIFHKSCLARMSFNKIQTLPPLEKYLIEQTILGMEEDIGLKAKHIEKLKNKHSNLLKEAIENEEISW